MKAISILSGGLDSCVSTAVAINEGYEVIALHFNYFQRTQTREEKAFNDICDFYKLQRFCLDMDFFKTIGGSSLTDSTIDIPKDEISTSTPSTYVPFRNGVFYSIAASLAQRFDADAIFTGLVYEDASAYPDTSPDFVNKTQDFVQSASAKKIVLKTPLIQLRKKDIVLLAQKLNAPIHLSYSCYESNELACGRCESCLLRLKGFKEAGVKDLLSYQIPTN